MHDMILNSRKLREKLLSDPYRPGYHFCTPEDIGLPGDPNGAFYAKGRYHLMYLYRFRGDGFRWGHISSIDLVHWRHHPDSLIPDSLDGGIFSGGAFVDYDEKVYLTYWALPVEGKENSFGGIRIAVSCDKDYEIWEKFETFAVESTEFGITEKDGLILGSADPSNIWRCGDYYYVQTGNLCVLNKYGRSSDSPVNLKGDWVDLFRSRDLISWEYLHRFYQRDLGNSATDESEDDMCPSFLPLPKSFAGGEFGDKYLQLFISHNKGCQYYIGTYDREKQLFIPETHGRMTKTTNTFFAPEALIDAKGRQIAWSWLLDNPGYDELEYGWSGVYGLPRVLWEEEGELRMAPVPELNILRYNHQIFGQINTTGTPAELDIKNGLSCEIKLIFENTNAKRYGLSVRRSPDGEVKTDIYYDAEESILVLDTSKSGIYGCRNAEFLPFALNEGEKLELRIFIDKPVIEVFANNRQAIARRVYPDKNDCTGVQVYTENGSLNVSAEAWEMNPSNPY